ncbi:MAG: thiol:disulfide interchange protein DsbG [Steroidobacteraceae bacterium]
MRNTLLAAALIAVLSFVGPARGAPAAAQASAAAQATPPALAFPIKRGFHVVRTFTAVSGLTGWVMRDKDGQYDVFYTTADGLTLVTGQLLTSQGDDLSRQYLAQYAPLPDLSALWAKLQKASIVVTGAKGAPKSAIYVVMDPNCIFCHLLWIALKPYEAKGLQVRWIPIGFLRADSTGKAAALLQGGAAAMQQSQQHFDVQTESGGIRGIPLTAQMKVKLDSNLALMHAGGVQGTPGVFYKDAAGHVVHSDGMPALSDLPMVTGLPAQPELDPVLLKLTR